MDVAVSHDPPEDRLDELLDLYGETWFGAEWDRSEVAETLSGTDECVTLTAPDTGRVLAFAHVLTDYSRAAFLRDVVVRESARGEGVGRRLLEAVRAHPALAGVDRITVTCPESLAPFYEACGFERRAEGAILRAER